MININGNWTGVIIYGKEYRKFKNYELYFDMELIQQNEIIKGVSIDIGGFGTSPDKAFIDGTIIDNIIKFNKQYTTIHYYKNGKIKIDKFAKGKKIKYSGLYDMTTQTFSGHWIINGQIKLFGFIPINFKNTGTWTMKRK